MNMNEDTSRQFNENNFNNCNNFNNFNTHLDNLESYNIKKQSKILLLNNKTLDYYKYSKYNYTLYNIVKKEFSHHDNFFVISEGKIVPLHTKLSDIFDKGNYFRYDIIERQKGGSIIDLFTSIIQIGKFFILVGDFVIWIGKFIVWFFRFIGWVFYDLLNPFKLASEFFNSLMIILIGICRLPLDLLMSLAGLGFNTLGQWTQGFWGWDQTNLSNSDKESNYFKKLDRGKGKKCYVTDGNTVPFSVILGTIICPPIGVFMDMGATGWLNILICTLLTLIFYLPGLVYALLIIYS